VNRPADRIASCGDASCEFLVDPIPRPAPPPIVVVEPEVREVMLVDNRKPNSMAILLRVQRLLRERGITVKEEIIEKPDASRPLKPQVLDTLAEERGLVMFGVSD
jgi:hypothetical protein